MPSEITSNVTMITDMMSTIATADQDVGVEAVNQHVVLIRDVTNQASDSPNQNTDMNEQLTQQTLHQTVKLFKVS